MRIADDGSLVIAVAEPTEARLFALRSRFGDRIECVVIPKTALDVGLRSDLLAKTSPSPRRDERGSRSSRGRAAERGAGANRRDDEPEGRARARAGARASTSRRPRPRRRPRAEAPAIETTVVADFDETAGALSSLVEEQLQTLRAVVARPRRRGFVKGGRGGSGEGRGGRADAEAGRWRPTRRSRASGPRSATARPRFGSCRRRSTTWRTSFCRRRASASDSTKTLARAGELRLSARAGHQFSTVRPLDHDDAL